jgi:hypothetical protein
MVPEWDGSVDIIGPPPAQTKKLNIERVHMQLPERPGQVYFKFFYIFTYNVESLANNINSRQIK